MGKQGYIPLYRKLQEHWLWRKKRKFSEAEAWIDILMEAQHSFEPQKVLLGSTLLTCRYGQSLKSIRTWGQRWGWSQTKVKRFFKLLEEDGMATCENEHITTRLTVCNYGRYDIKRGGTVTALKRPAIAGESRALTDNNDKNENNEKKVKSSPDLSFDSPKFKSFEQIKREAAQQSLELAAKEFLGDG